MKRISLIALLVLISLCFSGCSAVMKILPVREYRGTPLTSLSYKTVDYMGGISETYLLDFEENTVTRTNFNPYVEEGEEERKTTLVCEFTEEAEAEFINAVYSYGLFGIKEHYAPSHTIMDGGGWTLVIEYSDGKGKKSTGDNAGPSGVFNNCALPFYNLTGEQVMGYIPTTYFAPPLLDYDMSYSYGTYTYMGNGFIDVHRGNYLWNGHEVSDSDIYVLATSGEPRLLAGVEYTIGLSTRKYQNYNAGRYPRFKECVVMSYALDPSLGDAKEILRTRWFKSVEFPFEPNRIYHIILKFNDGDFVQYVFSTAVLDQEIRYGEYHYNIYSKGKSVLDMREDNTFTLNPFDYFDKNDRDSYESRNAVSGKWEVEDIDGKKYIVLTEEKLGGILVFDYCADGLFLDFDKTTFDLKKFNLEGDPEVRQGRVDFTYYL